MLKVDVADQDSVEEYLALMRKNYERELIGVGWEEERAKLFTKSIGGKCGVFDLLLDRKHVGWMELYPNDISLDVVTIYVREEYRRQGITKKALNVITELYGSNRIIQTFVNASNEPSIKMHERLGFEVSGYTYIYNKHLKGIQ